jgi:Peptidase family M50
MVKLFYRVPPIVPILISIGFTSLMFSFKHAIAFYGSTWIAILVHETGHAIAARAGGLPIVRFQAGPVQVDYSTGHRRLRIRRMVLGLGVVTVDPRSRPPDEAIIAMRRVAIAGPLASFLCGFCTLYWLVVTFDQSPTLPVALIWFACINVALATSALMPGEQMDGTLFRRLKKGSPKARNLVQGYRLALAMGQLARPRERASDLPALAVALLNEPGAQLFPETKVTAARFLYEYLADLGRLPEALAWLEWSCKTVDWPRQSAIYDPVDALNAVRALHYALWNNDPVLAEIALKHLPKRSRVRRNAEALMPLAVIRLFGGDRNGAKKTVNTVRFGLQHSIETPGYAQMLNEWLDIIEQRINKAENSPAPSPTLAHTAAD